MALWTHICALTGIVDDLLTRVEATITIPILLSGRKPINIFTTNFVTSTVAMLVNANFDC